MMYDSLLARSFSKHEQKKLGYAAMLACFLMAFSFFTFFKPHLLPPQLNLHKYLRPVGTDRKLSLLKAEERTLVVNATSHAPRGAVRSGASHTPENSFRFNVTGRGDQDIVTRTKEEPVECNFLNRTDFCEVVKGDVRVDGRTGTVFIVKSDQLEPRNVSWSIRPYGRKDDQFAMSQVREWKVKPVAKSSVQEDHIPRCTVTHKSPGIIFSIGGYSGNHFHDFTDVLVPLFATARPFNGEVKLLVTDKNQHPGWLTKFQTLLKGLSTYEPIDIDNQRLGDHVHCFPRIIVGLKHRSMGELSIDPATSRYTIKDFMGFLRSKYSLKRSRAITLTKGIINGHLGKEIRLRPKLVIIARNQSRTFTNIGEIDKLSRSLGFDTLVVEPGVNLSKVAQIMNSCDVVVGVHGAGLTNTVFLPDNAILIQVVPFGGAEWLSATAFGGPSKDMSLNYLEYKIGLEESTLARQYPPDHIVLRNPGEIKKQGWRLYKSIYMDNQDVNLDVNRFRPTLEKALELLRQ